MGMFHANFTLMGVICIICMFFMLVCVKKVRFLAVLPEISQKVRNKRFYSRYRSCRYSREVEARTSLLKFGGNFFLFFNPILSADTGR